MAITKPVPVVQSSTLEDQRIRSGVLRHVREAAMLQRALPGEVELAKELGCSRPQVRLALAELERQGIVRRRQGAATTVDPVALRMSVRLEDQQEHTELLSRLGYAASVQEVSSAVVPMPTSVAPLLTAEAAPQSVQVSKRWFADGKPAMIATDTIALPAIDPSFTPSPAPESVFSTVERLWGESIVWEVATPGVAVVTEEQAELLELPVGSPVFTLELIGVAVSGRRLFHAVEQHNPAIVSYSFVRTVRPPWSGYGA